MKLKKTHIIVLIIITLLLAHQALAEDWTYYTSSSTRDKYYNKSSIKKVNDNNISLWTKEIFNENGKKEAFVFLKTVGKASSNPDLINHVLILKEIDCAQNKIKDLAVIFNDEKSNVLYSSPQGETGKWNPIIPNSVGEILKNSVCEAASAPAKVAVAPKVEQPSVQKQPVLSPDDVKPVQSKEAAVAPRVESAVIPQQTAVPEKITDKSRVSDNVNQLEIKSNPEEAIRNLVNKWLNSWKTGDMETYRSCYATDFKSKRMNLDVWVSHKDKIFKKSKNINISIDKLQISVMKDNASAVFTQSYSSSIFEHYSGTKTLELKKINDDWKIYRETM